MRRLGYDSFDVCYDGQEAVDKCRKLSYDLVLMDLQVCYAIQRFLPFTNDIFCRCRNWMELAL